MKTTENPDLVRAYQTIRKYPLFAGMSKDIVFWIAINTLFLTAVKGLSPSQINEIEAVGSLVSLLVLINLIPIVKKIGNITSVRMGILLMLLSSVLNALSTHFSGFLIAEICYYIGLILISIEDVILVNNLAITTGQDHYIEYQTKASETYALITLFSSFLSGFLFNINPYIPLVLSILILAFSFVYSFSIYDPPDLVNKDSSYVVKSRTKTLPLFCSPARIIIAVLMGAAVFSAISNLQKNSKLFIQQNMYSYLTTAKISVYFSIIITVSRISRLVTNHWFLRSFRKKGYTLIYWLSGALISAIVLLLIGNILPNGISTVIMSCGFWIILSIRDPMDNIFRKFLFDISLSEDRKQNMSLMGIFRKVFSLIFSLSVSRLLIMYDYSDVFLVMLCLSGMILSVLIISMKNYL